MDEETLDSLTAIAAYCVTIPAKDGRPEKAEDTSTMSANLAAYYDCIINWDKRLRRELPLLETIARAAGHRILVPACGTGGHVVALAERGFKVLGFDLDEDAVAVTQQKIASHQKQIGDQGGEATAICLGMENAASLGAEFDAAFCLGNALPGLSGPGQLAAALRGVARALHQGGVFFTQNLNYDRRLQEKEQFFPLLTGETTEEEVLLVKFADYGPEFINFHAMFLARKKPGGEWQTHLRSSKQIPLTQERMTLFLEQAGFGNLVFWGDYGKSPYVRETSNDLIALATKI